MSSATCASLIWGLCAETYRKAEDGSDEDFDGWVDLLGGDAHDTSCHDRCWIT